MMISLWSLFAVLSVSSVSWLIVAVVLGGIVFVTGVSVVVGFVGGVVVVFAAVIILVVIVVVCWRGSYWCRRCWRWHY